MQLGEGDTLIQNGANSAVGRAVIQVAARRGINTINLVRDRPGRQDTQEELMALGGTLVSTQCMYAKPQTGR